MFPIELYTQTSKQSSKQSIRALVVALPADKDDMQSSSILDAQEITKTLRKRNPNGYVKLLLNREVDSKNFWKWFDEILLKGDENHVRLLFIASHGDKSGFYPYSFDGKELILWTQINEKLKLK